MTSRPFAGLKVVDMTHVLAGPACTYLLSQMGAEIIKVEPPVKGDTVRNRGGTVKSLKEQAMGTNFLSQNAGKRSIVIDISLPKGLEIVRTLVRDADIFVENFRGQTLSQKDLLVPVSAVYSAS